MIIVGNLVYETTNDTYMLGIDTNKLTVKSLKEHLETSKPTEWTDLTEYFDDEDTEEDFDNAVIKLDKSITVDKFVTFYIGT